MLSLLSVPFQAMAFLSSTEATVILVLSALFVAFVQSRKTGNRTLPPGPSKIPFFGNLFPGTCVETVPQGELGKTDVMGV